MCTPQNVQGRDGMQQQPHHSSSELVTKSLLQGSKSCALILVGSALLVRLNNEYQMMRTYSCCRKMTDTGCF